MATTHRSARRTRSHTRSSSRSSDTRRKPDALELLKEDHARVQSLFDEFEKAGSGREKHQIAITLCDELALHARLEEEMFYPAVREVIDDDELMNEAEVEHESAKELIAKIEASSASDVRFEALVTVLGEYIRHHVTEEEGEMFRQIRRSDLDVAALGEEMQRYKRASSGAARAD